MTRPSRNAEPQPARGDALELRLVAAAEGDGEAFHLLYGELLPFVEAVVTGVLRDRAQAEEVSQEVMIEVWLHAGRYRAAAGGVRSWVATIARRRAIDRVRHLGVQRRCEQRWAAEEHSLHQGEGDADPDERPCDDEAVELALGTLTALQFEAVHLAFYDDRSYPQVAGHLGIPLGTAKTRIRDALVRLRRELATTRPLPSTGAGAGASTGAGAGASTGAGVQPSRERSDPLSTACTSTGI
ncbi:sigma-70 family RNA polymerase sigma factor [Kitasatospora sp. NPDC051853]|uniref:sigma-70 family RNA polymerase sigma factor n=1 Tax=Kitasatospora sp. NPDC051853 TaxID=3364058 RepID=UPI0037AAA421